MTQRDPGSLPGGDDGATVSVVGDQRIPLDVVNRTHDLSLCGARILVCLTLHVPLGDQLALRGKFWGGAYYGQVSEADDLREQRQREGCQRLLDHSVLVGLCLGGRISPASKRWASAWSYSPGIEPCPEAVPGRQDWRSLTTVPGRRRSARVCYHGRVTGCLRVLLVFDALAISHPAQARCACTLLPLCVSHRLRLMHQRVMELGTWTEIPALIYNLAWRG